MRGILTIFAKWMLLAVWTYSYNYFMAQMLRAPLPSIAAALSTFSQLRPV